MALALSKEHIVAPPGFNRWRVAAASVSIHLCIGSLYAWSVFNPPLTRVLGVVAPAADDWRLGSLGCKNTYTCFFVLGTLLYLSLPWFASTAGRAQQPA